MPLASEVASASGWAIARGRFLLTAEADLAHPFGEEFVAGLEGDVVPWGGGAFSFFF